MRQDRAFLFTISSALKGILLSLLLALLGRHLKMSILGSVQTTNTVSLKFSEILKHTHRKAAGGISERDFIFAEYAVWHLDFILMPQSIDM